MKVTGPGDALAVFLPLLSDNGAPLPDERLAIIGINAANRVIKAEVIASGGLRHCVVDPGQIGRWALTQEQPCVVLILAHNHPSGDPTPSQEDLRATQRVVKAMNILGLRLLDHLIIGSEGRWTSMTEQGHIIAPYKDPPFVMA